MVGKVIEREQLIDFCYRMLTQNVAATPHGVDPAIGRSYYVDIISGMKVSSHWDYYSPAGVIMAILSRLQDRLFFRRNSPFTKDCVLGKLYAPFQKAVPSRTSNVIPMKDRPQYLREHPELLDPIINRVRETIITNGFVPLWQLKHILDGIGELFNPLNEKHKKKHQVQAAFYKMVSVLEGYWMQFEEEVYLGIKTPQDAYQEFEERALMLNPESFLTPESTGLSS